MEFDIASILEYAMQIGVPAFMGLIILYYLLAKFIPGQQEAFKTSMEAQQHTFEKALEMQQGTFERAIDDVISDNNSRTDKIVQCIKDETRELHNMVGPCGRLSPPVGPH